MAARSRSKHQGGFVTLEFALGTAFLLFPTFLLMAMLPTWSEHKMAATAAAREASREYVLELTSDPSQAQAVGDNAAYQVTSNYGINPTDVQVSFSCSLGVSTSQNSPPPLCSGSGGDFSASRGNQVIIADVAVQVPALPFGLGLMHAGFTVHSKHGEPVDVYRSFQ